MKPGALGFQLDLPLLLSSPVNLFLIAAPALRALPAAPAAASKLNEKPLGLVQNSSEGLIRPLRAF